MNSNVIFLNQRGGKSAAHAATAEADRGHAQGEGQRGAAAQRDDCSPQRPVARDESQDEHGRQDLASLQSPQAHSFLMFAPS